jgi:D-psicose/D-tagatose/L-ribulose 3-epimerase
VEDAGLVVSSLQAILYGRPNATLLGDASAFRAMQDHLTKVADIAEILGASVLVFGAPRNRLRGQLSEDVAMSMARERFAMLGSILHGRPIIMGIEPVPELYGGDFLTSAVSVLDMVHSVDHANIRVHLDTGCVKLAGDAIATAIYSAGDKLCHFHAAEPNLDNFTFPVADHDAAGSALHNQDYRGWIAIEMRETPTASLDAVERAVRWVRRTYSLTTA